ncbi:hypothetical protein SAMN05216223_106377 [Actinacidiphila yanglinensis]|uniref:Uncharacterized protein n=1 Tax=Actinacidiphila yanglinensis TaxID=310779 RepID=A0A1H6BAU8_9ACTN|nr:hypothetical protein [Actinacidiphila yanglinensis]SEG57963.1 hypothetical protein SAMN05216223_106377 [Actinacidiphila yanglinensis]
MSYPPALALTVAVEVPVYAVTVISASPARFRRTAVAAVMVNLVTHPLLWWFLSRVPSHDYWPAFAVAESVVCLVEGALMAWWLRLRGPVPYAASVAANAASVIAGMLLPA